MFKKFFFCLLLLPFSVLAETTPVPNPVVPLTHVEPLLAKLLDDGIRPLYRELDASGNTLAERSKTFCAEPTAEHFKVLRASWGETLLAWHRTDALLFGPAVEDQIDFRVNFNPPKKSVINGLLNDTEALTAASVDKAGVAGMGLSTLEFLLFDHDKSEADMLALFQGDVGQRRCAYVQTASELLQTQLHTVADGWLQEGEGRYASAFKTAHQGNNTFASTQQVIDLLVGKLYQSAEKMTKKRLGAPLGKGVLSDKEGDQQMLNLSNAYQLESWRSGYSMRLVRANVEGIQRLLDKGGLLQWLRDHDPAGTGKHTASVLEMGMASLLHLPVPEADPFTLVSTGNAGQLDGYYYQSDVILQGVSHHLARSLNVQLGFNDSDGD